jgi:hypothetical protein
MAPGRGRASTIGRLLRGLLAVAVVFATIETSARLVLSRDVISERVRKTSDAAWRLDWIDRHADGVEVYYSFDVYLREEGLRYHPDIVIVGFVQDDYCDEREAICLNLRLTFLERMAQGFAVKTPGHWHGSGHELVAEALSAFLAERGLAGS